MMRPTVMIAAFASSLALTGLADAQPLQRGAHEGGEGRGQGARALMMLGAADYDGDDRVTRQEVARLHGAEFSFRDRNGDGYLDLADASPTAQRLSAQRDGGLGRPMARLDLDEDGRVSRAEFVDREMIIFNRLDANDDDVVSGPEIDAALEARRAERGERAGRRAGARAWWRD